MPSRQQPEDLETITKIVDSVIGDGTTDNPTSSLDSPGSRGIMRPNYENGVPVPEDSRVGS
jgi:hypothetical protein